MKTSSLLLAFASLVGLSGCDLALGTSDLVFCEDDGECETDADDRDRNGSGGQGGGGDVDPQASTGTDGSATSSSIASSGSGSSASDGASSGAGEATSTTGGGADCYLVTVVLSGEVRVDVEGRDIDFQDDEPGPRCIPAGPVTLRATCHQDGDDPALPVAWGNALCSDGTSVCTFDLAADQTFVVTGQGCEERD